MPLIRYVAMFSLLFAASASAQVVPLDSLGCSARPINAACAARLGWIESQQVPMQGRRIGSSDGQATLELTRIGVAVALARAGDWAAAEAALDSLTMAPIMRLAGRADLAIVALAARRPEPIAVAGREFDTFVQSPDARGLVGGDVPFAYAIGAQINHARGNAAEARRMLAEAKSAAGNIAFSNLTNLTVRVVVATHDVEGPEAALAVLRSIRIDDGGLGTAAGYGWSLLTRGRANEARAAIGPAAEALSGLLQRRPPGRLAANTISGETWNLLALQVCLSALDRDVPAARSLADRFPEALARTASIADERAYRLDSMIVDTLRRVAAVCLATAHHLAGAGQSAAQIMSDIDIDDRIMLGHQGFHASEGNRALGHGTRGYAWAAVSLVWGVAGGGR